MNGSKPMYTSVNPKAGSGAVKAMPPMAPRRSKISTQDGKFNKLRNTLQKSKTWALTKDERLLKNW